jgi:hemolysin III
MGMVAARNRVGIGDGGDRLQVLVCESVPDLFHALYLAMGWLALLAAKPLLAHVSAVGLRWLVAGGAMYTIGVVFYASRRIPYGHAVCHLFVIAGSLCHYFAVLYAVVPSTKA